MRPLIIARNSYVMYTYFLSLNNLLSSFCSPFLRAKRPVPSAIDRLSLTVSLPWGGRCAVPRDADQWQWPQSLVSTRHRRKGVVTMHNRTQGRQTTASLPFICRAILFRTIAVACIGNKVGIHVEGVKRWTSNVQQKTLSDVGYKQGPKLLSWRHVIMMETMAVICCSCLDTRRAMWRPRRIVRVWVTSSNNGEWTTAMNACNLQSQFNWAEFMVAGMSKVLFNDSSEPAMGNNSSCLGKCSKR